MSWVAVGVTVAAGAVAAYGEYEANSAEADAHRANAEAAEEMAAYNRLVTEREEEVYLSRYDQAASRKRMGYGASGFEMSGSALTHMAFAAEVAGQEVGDIRLKGEMDEKSIMNQAQMSRTAADTADDSRAINLLSTGLGTASSAVSAKKGRG